MSAPSGKIQTVLGCINPGDLGVTLTHEHLSMTYDFTFKKPTDGDEANATKPLVMENLGWVRQYPYSAKANLVLREEEEAVLQEMYTYKAAGGCSVVENSIIGLERNMDFIKDLSIKTGVTIIAGTGYYFDASQTAATLAMSVEEMVNRITSDLTVGWEGSGPKCGVIGEVGCSWPLTDWEKKSLQATGEVQNNLGCPVIIHPGRHPTAPAEIVRILQEAGAEAGKIVMSHLDRTINKKEDLLEFASMGCINEFDLFGIEVSHYQHVPEFSMPSDAQRIAAIQMLMEEGYQESIVIAHDVHTKHRLTKYGGHGYSHILKNVIPMMKTRGMTQKQIDQLLIHTPKRWLTWK